MISSKDRIIFANDRGVPNKESYINHIIRIKDRLFLTNDRILFAKNREFFVNDRFVSANDRILSVNNR